MERMPFLGNQTNCGVRQKRPRRHSSPNTAAQTQRPNHYGPTIESDKPTPGPSNQPNIAGIRAANNEYPMRLQQNSESNQGDTLSLSMAGKPVRVHLEVYGAEDAARILVLHGWGASAELMRPLLEGLRKDYRVAAIDFPGHGKSPLPPSGYGIPEHCEIVEQVVRHLGWTRFGIVGHSNGGRVSLAWTASLPEDLDVAWLVLIAPSGIRRRRTAGYYVRSWTARILKAPFFVLPGRLRAFGLDWLRHSLVWRYLGSSDYRALEGVMRETFVQTVNHYVDESLHDIRVPVLVLRGSDDEAITAEQVETLVAGLPDAGHMTIQYAGHYAQLDRPDVILAAIRQMGAA